jgi:fructose-bisphosphate aldolase, class I
MALTDLHETAQRIAAQGKGILAADDSTSGITKRFSALGIESTEITRLDYRTMLFGATEAMQYVSGVILYDETFHQTTQIGKSIPQLIKDAGALVGIKLDMGQRPLAFCDGEVVSEGLDGLSERIIAYKAKGAAFAKWRGVFSISKTLPSENSITANTHALARYAALCQVNGLVPIVEPDILMAGDHTIERCAEVTSLVLSEQFEQLKVAGVDLAGMILKPNMVTAGADCPVQPSDENVAAMTLKVLRAHVPRDVPGIAFLSGGQTELAATSRLNAMNAQGPTPWRLTFSYNRALQDSALKSWAGKGVNLAVAQKTFAHRAHMNSLATLGQWSPELEKSA